jgi:hypothetical protein
LPYTPPPATKAHGRRVRGTLLVFAHPALERGRVNPAMAEAVRDLPGLTVLARAFDRRHAYDQLDKGAQVVERETFEGGLSLAAETLRALGGAPTAPSGPPACSGCTTRSCLTSCGRYGRRGTLHRRQPRKLASHGGPAARRHAPAGRRRAVGRRRAGTADLTGHITTP